MSKRNYERERVPVPERREYTQVSQTSSQSERWSLPYSSPQAPEFEETEFWYTPVLNRLEMYLASEYVVSREQVVAHVARWLNSVPDGYRALLVMTESEVRQHIFRKVPAELRGCVTEALLANKPR